MTEPSGEGLYIDSDWKEEARREKERLIQEERQQAKKGATSTSQGSFADLLNILVLQTVAALGGIAGPDGQSRPPDFKAAQYFIDMINLLDEKTAGNLSDEEKRLLDTTLYDLRMQYVRLTGQTPSPTAGRAAEGFPEQGPPAQTQSKPEEKGPTC